jgi:hypothetical protein
VREEGEEEETSTALNPLLKTLQETRIPYFFLSFLPSFPQSGHQSLLPLLTLHHITRKNPCRNWAVIDSFLEPRDEGTYSQPCWVPHTHQNLDTKHGREHTHTHSLSLSLSLSRETNGKSKHFHAPTSSSSSITSFNSSTLGSLGPTQTNIWQRKMGSLWEPNGTFMLNSSNLCVCFFLGCVCVCVCVWLCFFCLFVLVSFL